jgi:hypothetical protein
MTLTFTHYRPSGNVEYLVNIGREVAGVMPAMQVQRHSEVTEINSVKVEIIDNKPLYIPLGRSDLEYKFQFRTFNIRDFSAWYTVVGNDILNVALSTYKEFPVGSYWNVENITERELPGSSFSISPGDVKGNQAIVYEFELEVSRSLKDAASKDRPTISEDDA